MLNANNMSYFGIYDVNVHSEGGAVISARWVI